MTDRRIESHWQRARRYFAERNLPAATATCQAIIDAQPENSMAHWMLSTIHMDAGKPRLAAKYAIAASCHAHRLGIADLLKVSWSLIVSGESRHARDLLLQVDPDDPLRMHGLWGTARQLGLLELHERALICLDAIIDPTMRNVNVSHLRGSLLSIMGRPAEAAVAFEDAIGKSPQFALAHLTLSQLGLPEGQTQRIERLRRVLQFPPANPDHQAMLHYALFKELDSLDDTGAAWAALAAGMDARSRTIAHDPARETQLFDQMIQATNSDFLANMDAAVRSTGDTSTPIFIVGMPRTGTTLLERILGNHPDVQVCGELTAFVQQHQWVADRTWPGMFDEHAAIAQPQLDAALLGSRYLDAVVWRTQGKRYFSDKTPGNFMAVALILKALPGARIIHIHRDPIDACFSNLKVLFAPDVYQYSYSLLNLANHHRNYARLMRHWDTMFPDRVLSVAYEDLVRDSNHEAARILAYCGLEARAGITDVTVNRASVSTESRSQVREPIHQRNVGGWRRYATQLRPLERLLSDPG